MNIQCECGKFRAELSNFPKESPGRLRCYCDDCQAYLHHLQRADLLDENGGTEILAVYPSNFKILQGKENLTCTRLSPTGLHRFSTICCKTPIANTDPKRPWLGLHRQMYAAHNPRQIEQFFSKIRSSILGKFAHGNLPPDVPQTFDLKAFVTVAPFILKGVLLGRRHPSPFFENDAPIAPVKILSLEERKKALASAGHTPKT